MSPSPTPVWRKAATAPRARSAWVGERWMSSNTTAKLRPATAVGDDVGGDDRAPLWRACVARDLGHHDRLEAGERLLDTVLGDDEVVAGEAADGLALLVHDRHVDGHELDLRLERGLGRRWGGLGRLGGGAEEDETEDREGETLHVATGYRLARGRIKARAPRRRWLCLDRSRGRRCAPRRGSGRRAAPPRPRIARARSAPREGSRRTGSGPGRRAAAGQARAWPTTLGVAEELERDLRGLRQSRGHVGHEEEADLPGPGPPAASVTQGTMRASPTRNGSSEARAPFGTRSVRFTTARLLSPNVERPGGTLSRLWSTLVRPDCRSITAVSSR